MEFLSSTASKLILESSIPQKLSLLQSTLQIIKDQLAEDDNTIVNDKDRYISVAQFSSNYKSRSPFFVWPASKFGAQIKKLLSGHQVNFVASVLHPKTENAVIFKTIMVNLTSRNPTTSDIVQNLLEHFDVEMIHGGESYYKCGTHFYSIPGDRQHFQMSFERNENREYVSVNRVWEKLRYGDVPLSLYTVWRFQLKCQSKSKNFPLLFKSLSSLAHKVDLELIGSGYFLADNAPICKKDLSRIYSKFARSIL